MSGRSQRVMLNGTLSDSSDLNFGVPQGSCLWPLLFILYASKLFDIINNHSPGGVIQSMWGDLGNGKLCQRSSEMDDSR